MVAFTELDAASQGTTADMRRIVEHLSYDVPGVKKRIYLLDEAHRMSRDAQDVLLKPIEDKRVVVMLCTTEYGKIRETITSRCETHEIRKIQKEDILARARHILTKEQVAFEEEAVLMVIDHARGHVRDVLNKLETIAQLGPITVEAVRERLDLSIVPLYYDVLLSLGNAAEAITRIEQACERVSASQVTTGIAEAAMSAFRHANKIQTDYSQVDQQRAAQVYERFGPEVTNLARYFLSLGPSVTRLDLVCAAVACTGATAPGIAERPRLATPPVLVMSLPPPGHATPPAQAPPQPTAPITALAIGAASPPATPQSTEAPKPSEPAPPRHTDNNIPTWEDEASVMLRRQKGVGPSNPGYKPAKSESRSTRESESYGLTLEGFTAVFHETLGVAASHGK